MNVGTHKKNVGNANSVNRDYSVVLKDRIKNRVESKIAEMETAEIKDCL